MTTNRMVASPDEIERALKKAPDQARAQSMINRLMRLKALSEDYGSPLIVHLRAELEKLASTHGINALKKEDGEEDRKYFQVYSKAWEIIDSVVVDYYKANKNIIEQSRR